MLEARAGSIPDEVKIIAREEEVDENKLRDRLSEGRVIIPRNLRRLGRVKVIGIGEGLSTKVNVNVGTSSTVIDLDMEIEKTRVAVKYGSDTIMDLSIGGDIAEIRRVLLRESEPLPFGTVPTYQVYLESAGRGGSLPDEDFFFRVLEEQLRDGVDFMTIHAGIGREL
ncbi:MAG: phosphomethylpyrimidine synthase ThiC, partial [Thaumarchaeota archaeon]|nr:phosphomethylpyrimidine synthase ThiC [Nitrososphaerota archaeon]